MKRKMSLVILIFIIAINIPKLRPIANDSMKSYDTNLKFSNIGWNLIDDKWYYYEGNGNLRKGWLYESDNWYFLNYETGIMETGWIKDGNTKYYLKSNGAMAKGWNYIDSKWYLMDGSGGMLTGWNKINGLWYYLESDGIMSTGWKKIGENWYYLDTDGRRLTNEWRVIDGIEYWFNAKGIMAVGEAVIDGETYYFDNSGKLLEKIGKKPYLFVQFLKTEDSDSIYIELPNGDDVLIDGGEAWHGKYVTEYLKTRKLSEGDGVDDIDYLINTHPHSDHIGGFIDVLSNFKVNKFYYPHDIKMKKYDGFEGAESIENIGYTINCMNYCYQFYDKVMELVAEKGIETYDTISNTYIDDNNILKFIHPNKTYKQTNLDKHPSEIKGVDYCDFNNDSAVILASYYDFNMLLAADIHVEAEKDIINLGLLPNSKIDVLKIPHHGHNTSSSREFIDALSPTFGVLTRSEGAYNSANSNKELIKLMKEYNVNLLETWRENIRIYATDTNWNIEY